jgi:hypothetical protein
LLGDLPIKQRPAGGNLSVGGVLDPADRRRPPIGRITQAQSRQTLTTQP